jgi:hypothetical protein
MYVNYKGETGRTTGYYVPKAFQQRVRNGLEAWKQFQSLAKQIAQLNKELMDDERPRQTRKKKTT